MPPIGPSGNTMGGPPVPPPEVPTLSAMPMGGAGSAPGAGQSGAIIKLFYGVDKTLDVIASAIPGSSEKVQAIKNSLRDLMASTLQQGAGGTPSPGTSNAGAGPY